MTNNQGARSYEVFQRQTERDIPIAIPTGFDTSNEFLKDPYPTLELLRSNYGCFYNRKTNSWWITRYDDVTSVFADCLNFSSPMKSLIYHAQPEELEVPLTIAVNDAVQHDIEAIADDLAEEILARLDSSEDEIIGQYVRPYSMRLLAHLIGVPQNALPQFDQDIRAMHDGSGWHPGRLVTGKTALHSIAALFTQLLLEPQSPDSRGQKNDLLSQIREQTPTHLVASAATSLAILLLEVDVINIESSLANTLFLLLTHPKQLEIILEDETLAIRAWQESLRHSPPVLHSSLYTTRDVERFGQLLPEGSLVVCSVAGANRDPLIFTNPSTFNVDREDLAYREPLGQFRIDGLASAVIPGLIPLSQLGRYFNENSVSMYQYASTAVTVAIRSLLRRKKNLHLVNPSGAHLTTKWPQGDRVCTELLTKG
jgi:cytochrome P450